MCRSTGLEGTWRPRTQFSRELCLQPTVWPPYRGPRRRSPGSMSTDARSLSSRVELCPISRQRGFFSLQIMRGFVRGARWRLWREGLDLIHPYPRGQCGQKLHKCPDAHRGHRPRPTRRGQYCTQPATLWLNCQQPGRCSNSRLWPNSVPALHTGLTEARTARKIQAFKGCCGLREGKGNPCRVPSGHLF